jgi:hypothetical protein
MRRNTFGDAYCHTADEARREIDNSENGWQVYAGEIDPPEDDFGAVAEIRENVSGDLVCYIEAKTETEVQAIIDELKLERSW